MKKMILLVAVAFAMASTSCKKDYDCECTIMTIKSTAVIANSTKSDATDACDALATSAKLVDSAAKCEIK